MGGLIENQRAQEPILVTGGAGFLGRRVVDRLLRSNYDRVFVARSKDYDLRREPDVKKMISTVRPRTVIHLAAVVGGIGANRRHPGRFFYENLMMGANLMEAARVDSVEKFVAIGTVCAYPKHTAVPFREDSLWDGYPEETNAPYGLAKKMLLVQGQAYRAEYGFNCIYLLPTNLYGPGDNFDPESSHVIPALIRKCVEAVEAGASSIEVWGDGSASREFLFVEDAAEAIVLATERFDGAEPVNVGASHEISIKELVTVIAQKCGFTGELRWDTSKPNGQPRRCLDTSRAEKAFGFRAKTSFDEGLGQTVDWYRRERTESAHGADDGLRGWVAPEQKMNSSGLSRAQHAR
jgi:GDP-L-fucose synthase